MLHATRRASYRLFAILAITLAFSFGAHAQDRELCSERDGTRSIEACSRAIASNQLTGKDLATIYVLRASIYRANRDYSHAIEDITRAIDLLTATASKDVVASAYVTRASIYMLSGDFTNALSDYHYALGLDASNIQAAHGLQDAQAQIATTNTKPDGAPSQPTQLAAPNEPMPPDIPIAPSILQLIQTHPFFANAPPIRVAGFSYEQLTSNAVNGFRGGTSATYDTSDKWLRPGVVYEQTIGHSTTTYSMTAKVTSKMSYLGAANGLVSLGYLITTTSYVPTIKPISSTSKNVLVSLTNFQGAVFPLRVGNRFSWQAAYHATIPPLPDDELAETEQCEFSQSYEARSFHPDLTGMAYLETCQDQMTYKRNKNLDNIGQSRTLFFGDLGVSIRVDPQSPPAHIIQTYFQNETVETARLHSFLMAR
jgi:hypothetical protein